MKDLTSKCKYLKFIAVVGMVFCGLSMVAQAAGTEKVQANRVAQVTLKSSKTYNNPFVEVEPDAVVTRPDGNEMRVTSLMNIPESRVFSKPILSCQ